MMTLDDACAMFDEWYKSRFAGVTDDMLRAELERRELERRETHDGLSSPSLWDDREERRRYGRDIERGIVTP